MEICNSVTEYLVTQNFQVKFCTNVKDFVSSIQTYMPQFLVMDKFVDKLDTLPMIDQIRKSGGNKDIPIIVVTGSNGGDEMEKAIDMGADDILIKPFSLNEIKVRLKSLSRRSACYSVPSDVLTYKDIQVDCQKREVFKNNEKIPLTETEFKIFLSLVQSKGTILKREVLVNRALTLRNNGLRTIDVHMNALRTKLGELGYKIKTLRGRGYMLID